MQELKCIWINWPASMRIQCNYMTQMRNQFQHFTHINTSVWDNFQHITLPSAEGALFALSIRQMRKPFIFE